MPAKVISDGQLAALVREAAEYHREHWLEFDDTLYAVCKNARHDSMSSICARLWLVNGAMTAQLQRAVKPGIHPPAGSLATVAELLQRNATTVVTLVDRLRAINAAPEPWWNAPDDVVAVVTEFCGLLRQQMREASGTHRRNQRSFASKFLHFHVAQVPIYDAYANSALNQLANCPRLRAEATLDVEYRRFAHRFAALCQHVAKLVREASIRDIDSLLLLWHHRHIK
ncbi:MAG: hypothetical protein AAF747_07690 [Planctomycetota bacterium]